MTMMTLVPCLSRLGLYVREAHKQHLEAGGDTIDVREFRRAIHR